jgi:hypothetical protein
MNTLTEEQIKSLKLFAHYCMGYGAEEVSQYQYVENCEINYYENYWQKGFGNLIEGYDRINEVIKEIIEENDLPIEGEVDCDNNGQLRINIDCKEKKIEITRTEYQFGSNDLYDEKELNEDENWSEFFNEMREDGFKVGIVKFDGGGDSGEIYNKIEFDGEFETDLEKDVLSFLYNWLGGFYGGWEINEGSHGEFMFMSNGKVELHFYEHNEDEVQIGQVFYSEF